MIPAPKKQQGVALITMLMVFSICTIMVAHMIERLHIDIKRSSHHHIRAQAHQYALGAEALARQVLFRDLTDPKTAQTDNLSEAWSEPNLSFPIDAGHLSLNITDLHSRFNINNVVTTNGMVDPSQSLYLKNIFKALKVDEKLASRVADWIDADNKPYSLNGEDQGYLGKEVPYRTANQHIGHITELRAIDGFDALSSSQWKQLTTLTTAVPSILKINVNTASSKLLKIIDPQLDIKRLDEYRLAQPKGFESVRAYIEATGPTRKTNLTNNLTVSSEYFAVESTVTLDSQEYKLLSRIYRDTQKSKVRLIDRELIPFWQ